MAVLSLRRRSRRIAAVVSVTALFVGLLGACGSGEGSEESIELRFATGQSRGPAYSQGFLWWAEEVEMRTEGRVTFKQFWDASLVGSTEVLGAVRDGRADLGQTSPAYEPASFPLWGASQVPFVTSNADAAMRAWFEVYETNEAFQQEFDALGVRPVFFDAPGATVLATRSRVAGLSDLDGASFRAIGMVGQALASIGAEPLSLAAEEVYESVERGVIDGIASVPLDALVGLGWHEVAPNVTNPGIGVYLSMGVVMNADVYDDLPDDIRKIMDEVSAEYADRAVEILAEVESSACDAVLDGGGELYEFPTADREEWSVTYATKAVDDWLASLDDSKVDKSAASDVYEQYVAATRKYEAESTYQSGFESCLAR